MDDFINGLPQSTVEKLLNPAAQEIGDALGNVFHIVFSPLTKLRILSDKKVEDFKRRIVDDAQQIPEKNRDPSKIGLVFKALEESRYQLNNEILKKMFVDLIVASLDDRVNESISPRYATVLAQLSPKDAILALRIYKKENHSMPTISFLSSVPDHSPLASKDILGFADGHYIYGFRESIDILVSLGVVEIGPKINISHNEEYSLIYDDFTKENKISLDRLGSISNSYIELTSFGIALFSLIQQ